jgi:thiamine-monophosphate kinase
LTSLKEIGEYGLHTWLMDTLRISGDGLTEPGDDCAFLDLLPNHYLLVTSDRLPLNLGGDYGGRLVVIQNFSDIVSKGGRPIAFLLDVYLPREATLEAFQQIVLGAKREVEKYDAHIIGGDVKEDHKLTVVGVGIGLVAKPHRVSRRGARPGDLVLLTLAGGEQLGMRWAKIVVDYFSPVLPSAIREVLDQVYARDIRIPCGEMQAAVATGRVTASIDNSDGLGGSLQILSQASGVGFALDREQLLKTLDPHIEPVAQALSTDPLRFAFAPGYDWQCLLTVPERYCVLVQEEARKAGGEVVVIGEVIKEKVVMLREGGRRAGRLHLFGDEKFKPHPWEHQPKHWLEFPLLES